MVTRGLRRGATRIRGRRDTYLRVKEGEGQRGRGREGEVGAEEF